MKLPVEKETAIVELARVVAAQYLAEHEDDSLVREPEEFISAIETEIRSTLRDEIAKMATLRQVEETPTLDPSSSSGMDLTLDPEFGPLSKAPEQPAAVQQPTPELDATLDPSSAAELSGLSVDSPTMDSADPLELDTNKSPRPTPAIRSGGSQSKSLSKTSKELSAPPGYEIISTLGKGGMGVVYKARHVPLDRTVAVKMIISGEHASEDQIRRFQKEAEAAANLSHPNIVSVYEVGEHQGLPFFSLEFVDGPSLSEQLKETTMSDREAASILLPIARAIEYSHQRGILHRDLKPQNILLTPEGVPKVADFGLAKRLDSNDGQTMTGVVVGTPGYLAPEQAADTRKVGPHTDVYALGCILYCIMTGRPPFKAPTAVETVRQLLFQEPMPPSKFQENLDKDLETICMKALEKEISKRYRSAGELADELQRYLNGEPIVARPVTRKERFWKWCKRNPGVASLSGVAASLLTFLLFGGITSAIVINAQKGREQEARKSAETFAELAEQNKILANDQA
ncbi:MAG: protein kinase, partial [Pirellulaceae bacterium]